MAKIAFFIQHLISGGVENALISLCTELQKQDHELTVYLIWQEGAFTEKMPLGVRVCPIPMAERQRSGIMVGGIKHALHEKLAKHRYVGAFSLAARYLLHRPQFAELCTDFDRIPPLSEHYDIAVNFHMHSPFLVRYLSERVSADKKLCWIHNDFTTTGYDIAALAEYLACCDAFFGVSERLVREFSEALPQYAGKTSLALNLVPTERILLLGEQEMPSEYPHDGLPILLSVGRLEEQKGYDITLEVARRLFADGIAFHWFVLGEGSLHKSLEKRARKLGVHRYVRFLGLRANPYPYFKHCDLYVQTSRHEGYVTTVTEAKIFRLPILCTDVAGAREQLDDGIDGEIAEISADSVYTRLHKLLTEPARRDALRAALARRRDTEDYSYLSVFSLQNNDS